MIARPNLHVDSDVTRREVPIIGFAAFDNFAERFAATALRAGTFHRVWGYNHEVFVARVTANGHLNSTEQAVHANLAAMEAQHGPWYTWKPEAEEGFSWLHYAVKQQQETEEGQARYGV